MPAAPTHAGYGPRATDQVPLEFFCQAVRVAVVDEEADATTVMTWVAFPTVTGMANGSAGGGAVLGVVLVVVGALVVLGGFVVVV